MLIYTLLQRLLVLIFHIKLFINKVCSLATHFMGRWRHYVFDLLPSICAYIQRRFRIHWRQPRRGCRGHIPQFFGWGGEVNGNIPPILLRTFGYSRTILVALRSFSLKPISFGYKTPQIRFSQAGRQSAHKARPHQP